ncbi:MAG: hypothetical protein VX938_13550, partial [Myxococcota bacterium]|nr:hypothetical protein [Myxococcota bacterium]
MKRTLVLMMTGLMLSTAAQAAVPLRVPVQGALRDNAGVPVANDVFAVRFALYPSPDAIEPLWVEHHPPEGVDCGDLPQHCVHVKGGVFQVQLGSSTGLSTSLFSESEHLWLGVRVETDPELPRRPLGSAPYALHAGSAAHLACTGCVGLDTLSPEAIAAMNDQAITAVESQGYITSVELSSAIDALAPVAHSGVFSELTGIPPGLADGDDDSLASLDCSEGQVPKRLGESWTCSEDTALTEEQVDTMVANNGYADASTVAALTDSLATVAT